jgi:general secretion pathway protein H
MQRSSIHGGAQRPNTGAPAWIGAAGFTLIEVMVTLVILVLAAAVVVPSLSKTSLGELRSTCAKVAGTVRATYDQAALSGKSHRLAFDLKTQVIKVEVDSGHAGGGTAGLMALADMMRAGPTTQKPAPQDALKGLGKNADPKAKVDEVQPPKELMALLGDSTDETTAVGLAEYSSAGHDFPLPKDIRLLSVWVEGMSQPVTDGVVYLTFYPGGHTENALVHLTTKEGTIFTVRVEALTGDTAIADSYLEARP